MKRIRIHASHTNEQGERFPAFVIVYDQDEIGVETTIGHLALEDVSAQGLKAAVDLIGEIAPVLEIPFEVRWTGWEPPQQGELGPVVEQIRTVLRMLGIGGKG